MKTAFLSHYACATIALATVTIAVGEATLVRDFEDGLGEWAMSDSNTSGGGTVDIDGAGHLRMRLPAGENVVRYRVLKDGALRFSSIEDGSPVEVRVDLVNTVGTCSAYILIRFDDIDGPDGRWYIFGLIPEAKPVLMKSPGSLFWSPSEVASVSTQNVRLVLVVTAAGPNVIFRTQVLDLADSGPVLFDRTAVDTPGQDTNIAVGGEMSSEDRPEPYFGPHDVGFLLDTFRYNEQWPIIEDSAEVLLDNFRVIKHDAPLVSAESAVRVSFPATDRAFNLLSAPSVNGPWEAVNHPSFEHNGFIHFMVPASSYRAAEFFELRER